MASNRAELAALKNMIADPKPTHISDTTASGMDGLSPSFFITIERLPGR